jgi:hypothetical protein
MALILLAFEVTIALAIALTYLQVAIFIHYLSTPLHLKFFNKSI